MNGKTTKQRREISNVAILMDGGFSNGLHVRRERIKTNFEFKWTNFDTIMQGDLLHSEEEQKPHFIPKLSP